MNSAYRSVDDRCHARRGMKGRAQVIRLRRAGRRYDEIAAETGLSRTGVFDICKRHEAAGAKARCRMRPVAASWAKGGDWARPRRRRCESSSPTRRPIS